MQNAKCKMTRERFLHFAFCILHSRRKTKGSRHREPPREPLRRELREEAKLEVIPASTELQDRGAKLFADRPDKEWSLTDCISFVVMSDRRMQDALTIDRVLERNECIADGSTRLWECARALLDDAVSKGFLKKPGRD